MVLVSHLLEGSSQGFSPGDNDNVISRQDLMAGQALDLTNFSLDPVPFNGIPDSF